MTDAHLDEELSALIDGELDAERERRLRARIAAEPQLAERLARLQGVDAALRALPETPLPAALQDSLRERIARETPAEAKTASVETAGAEGAFDVRALPSRRRLPLWAGAGLAAAAAGVVWILLPEIDPAPDEGWVPELAGSRTVQERSEPERSGAGTLASEPGDLPRMVSTEEGTLAGATDEEIGIALDFEMLADLEVIEDLELLEWMAEQDEQTSGNDGTERG